MIILLKEAVFLGKARELKFLVQKDAVRTLSFSSISF